MKPDVALIALNFVLVSSAGAVTRTTGEYVVGARVRFNVPCKKEKHEKVWEGGSWRFAGEGRKSVGLFENIRGVEKQDVIWGGG